MRLRIVGAGVAIATFLSLQAPALGVQELTTFGYGNARLGSSPSESILTARRVSHLHTAWTTRLKGSINAQPLVVQGVSVNRRRRNLVFVGTEGGQLAALDEGSGKVLWKRQFGTRILKPDCGASVNSRFGITGTPVIDKRAGLIYAVDVNGLAWALRLSTGRVAPGWPIRVHNTIGEFVWGALSLSRGFLYVPIASLCDTGTYFGGVEAIDPTRRAVIARWRSTAGTTSDAGGIWGWGGVSIDRRTGDLYGATGNSYGTFDEADGYAERVVQLGASLLLRASDPPLKPPFKISDRDFGTTPVLIDAPGCPSQLVAINKIGQLYLYERDRIASGPVQRLTVAADSPSSIPLYGVPAYDPATRTLVLDSPSHPPGSRLQPGIQAFVLAKSCRLALRWQHRYSPPFLGSAPTIAGGVVYFETGRDNWVRAWRLSDGRLLWSKQLPNQTFSAPAVVNGTLLATDWSGRVWAFRAR